jgi:hypothetical protein
LDAITDAGNIISQKKGIMSYTTPETSKPASDSSVGTDYISGNLSI